MKRSLEDQITGLSDLVLEQRGRSEGDQEIKADFAIWGLMVRPFHQNREQKIRENWSRK